MKAVIYCRVSTDEDRQNIDNQLIPLRDLAKALNFEVQKEYIDYASGGNSNRPNFQIMMQEAQTHQFDVVLIWSLDRFSREGILNTLNYLNIFKQNHIHLKSLQESWLDTRDEGLGGLLIAIFSWVAEQERKRLTERIKAGLKNKKKHGKRGKDKSARKRLGYFQRWSKYKKLNK